MPPALLLLRFGHRRRLTLPVPLFILWPLQLLAWLVLGFAWLVTSGRSRPKSLLAGLTALRALSELRGTKIDVRGRGGMVFMRFV